VRFETFDEDMEMVWMEITSAFPLTPTTNKEENFKEVTDNISRSWRFLSERGVKFLSQFDDELNEIGDEES